MAETPTPAQFEEARSVAKDALVHAVKRDDDGVRDALTRLSTLAGENAALLMIACLDWATVAGKLMTEGEPADAVGFALLVRGPQGLVNPDELPAETRPEVWAARFVTAVRNGDRDTAAALFNAPSNDELVFNAVSLLRVAATCLRDAPTKELP